MARKPLISMPAEFGALRDWQSMVRQMYNKGVNTFSTNPYHSGPRPVNVNNYINSHQASVPYNMRINR